MAEAPVLYIHSQMTNTTKATKAELHMYRNWKAQYQLELKNGVQAADHKLIEEL